VFIGVLRKKLKPTVIQKYFSLEILINVSAGAPGKYITGAALDRPAVRYCNRRSHSTSSGPLEPRILYKLTAAVCNEGTGSNDALPRRRRNKNHIDASSKGNIALTWRR
jgi:hypothetical protein